jgi:hypothetical protein
MRSIVIWTKSADDLQVMVTRCVPYVSRHYETDAGRWILEMGEDDYVAFTVEPGILDDTTKSTY